MSEIEAVADRVSALVAVGDAAGAGTYVESFATTNPAAYEIGYTGLALAKRDAATAIAHARRAIDVGAGALGHHYHALALVLAGDGAAAIDAARRAVALDRSPRSRGSLASVMLATGRADDAVGILKQIIAETPRDHLALLNLAIANAQVGDFQSAILNNARAFEANPGDTRAIHNLVNMFADIGRWLGAIAALEMTRETSTDIPPEVAVTLDVAMLHMIRLVSDVFPQRGIAQGDAAVAAAINSASARAPKIQLSILRQLLDLGRVDDAAAFVTKIEGQPLDASDRAVVAYAKGVLARHRDDTAGALALYEQALALDPHRADACVNATQLLLEDGSAAALARIDALVAIVPADRRPPELLFNHAAVLAKRGERDQARDLLERVIRTTAGNGRVGKVALAALRELG